MMKTEIKMMTLSEIKHMLHFRLFFLFLTALFSVLAVLFAFGQQLMQWPLAQSLIVAAVCFTFSTACLVVYLRLKRRLAKKGL
jgi:hypothetical protein